jgi:hypothetical protein
VRHFTIIWRNALIPQAFNDLQTRGLVPGFEAWLWKHFSEETPYDRMVHELITTPIDFGDNAGGVLNAASSPSAFFIVRQLQPENLATGTSRAFLGVRWIVLNVMIIRSTNGSAINSGAWRRSTPAFNAPKALIRRMR